MVTRWRPGELDQKITIQRESATDDGFGGETITLSTVMTPRCKVVPRNGNERFFSDRVEAVATYLFVIRNRTDVTLQENDRILYNNEEYNVLYINREGNRPLYLELFAERGVAQ